MTEAAQQGRLHQDPAKSPAIEISASPDDGLHSTPRAGEGTPRPSVEKSISCVSCRRRKLKCDRAKPKCGTCSRLKHHDCEYPERRRNLGTKRRNIKELEARLAQVETKLVSETNTLSRKPLTDAPTVRDPVRNETDPNLSGCSVPLNGDGDISDGNGIDPANVIGDHGLSVFDFQAGASTALGGFNSQELISLGLQEPLPPEQVQDELHGIYFNQIHCSVPMMHKRRYLQSLKLGPNRQPPVCLRYAVWAIAATVSEKYTQFQDVFYERARAYAQVEEMKGHGEAFVTLSHAQCWNLIATYEVKRTFFTRAWMSTGRCTRLVHMMGLYRIDGTGFEVKQTLPPARDWTELEERRRTFWAAYHGDRWASAGTGWPMMINESEIFTNLPSSEEAFENGREETSMTLSEALVGEGASRLSPFAGVVVSATLFGHNFGHIHRRGIDEHPEDIIQGEFWNRHRRMDNTLSNTMLFLPPELKLPRGLRDSNVVFLQMNLHTAVICLHQAAIITAEKHNLDRSFLRYSQTRCTMAAEEITNIMRLVSHIDPSELNSWMGFCLYVAGGIFIQDQKSANPNPQSMSNLEFLLSAMKAFGRRHPITTHFTTQLELDIAAAGIPSPYEKQRHLAGKIRSIENSPNLDERLASENSPANGEGPNQYQSGHINTSDFQDNPPSRADLSPLFPGVMLDDSQKDIVRNQHDIDVDLEQLDSHLGSSKDDTSRFFIVSQEPRSKQSPATTLQNFSTFDSDCFGPVGAKRPSMSGDNRGGNLQDTININDSEQIFNGNSVGRSTGGQRVPWDVLDPRHGGVSDAAFTSQQTCALPHGVPDEVNHIHGHGSNTPAYAAPAQPPARHRTPAPAPSPNVNSTQFQFRESTKGSGYQVWDTQGIDAFSMDNGWNVGMTDITMQDDFQMDVSAEHHLREGNGAREYSSGIALGVLNWNHTGR